MRVFKFAAGLAVGYVLGSRAGREKYEQIVAAARKVQGHPTVVEVQQVAKDRLGLSTDSAASHADTSELTTSAATNVQQPGTESSGASPDLSDRTTRRRSSPARTAPTTTIEPPA
ncbi:hypothetical protein OWR29_37705 [Actinoplanes sp. Pm04-4]|uniref:YtxH domain-containing protein n=1 Tax=Paractinoplanes pyxinae TaxID=2997416 RepID=A0ABT4BB66_9ACTN|nr:hypothetical protein [Actinoplanes pyxinae]MCY1143769.1 hypothetical protein [Actinoplanes pyxinae]